MINVDHFMTIGSSHQVCEDYIISGTEPFPYIILADGCSSSKDTDIGARILAHCAKKYLTTFHNLHEDCANKTLAYNMIYSAKSTLYLLGLHETCLDATLIIAFERDDEIVVWVYGDGNIIIKHRKSELEIINFDCNNMPFYLSYYLNDERQQLWHNRENAEVKINGTIIVDDEEPHTFYHSYDFERNMFEYRILKNEIEMLAITSDGIESFDLNYVDIVRELVAFKNTNGEFVKRRCKRALKNFHKDGYEHYDDISFGAMIIGENNENS